VVQKLCQFFLAIGPDDESIIYISEPAYRFVYCLFYCFLLKSSMKKFTITGESGGPITTPSVCRTVHQYRNMWMLVHV